MNKKLYAIADCSGRLLDSVGKRDRRDPARSAAEEAARRSPTGKRVAWNGNHPTMVLNFNQFEVMVTVAQSNSFSG